MNFLFYDIILFIAFCAIAGFFLLKHRKKVKREGILILYRTKFGLKFIDRLVKRYPRFFNFLTTSFIITAFIGMAAIFFMLAFASYKLAVMPVKEAATTPFPIFPILPWVRIPGLPMIYFAHWIIVIFVVAIVHEGFHGIFARLNKVRLKSSGFGFLGPIALAFVEPDEKQLSKKSAKAQLSVFSAGPVANLITALIVLLIISFIINPLYVAGVKDVKIAVVQVENNSPAYVAGIEKGDIISIDNVNKTTISDFFLKLKPNQTLNIAIEDKNKSITLITATHPDNSSRGYMGVGISLIPQFEGLNRILPFVLTLFFWIWLSNFFVGLINLLPFWIFDGCRMFYIAALARTKSKKKAQKITKVINSVSLFLIFLMIFIWIVRRIYGI